MKKNPSPHELKEYIQNNQSANLRDITSHFGCSLYHINSIRKKHGIPYSKKHRSCDKLQAEDIQKYVLENPDATHRQIAAHFGCAKSLVSYKLKRHSIPYIRKNQERKFQLNELREYVRDNPNATQNQIAAHLNCPKSSVRYALKHFGIKHTRKKPSIDSTELKKFIQSNPKATRREIAVRFGIKTTSVNQALRVRGIIHKFQNLSMKLQYDELKEYLHHNPNLSQQQIAVHFHRTPARISSALKHYGIPYERKSGQKL